MLLSNCPFEDVETIYLDYRSRTSVNLSKVLARNWWKRDFKWANTSNKFDFLNIGMNEAVVLIGDQCFGYEKSYRYRIDLAGEWNKMTGLPFVFACWTANKVIDPDFLSEFNSALETGVNNIDAVVSYIGSSGLITGDVLKEYLTENIDFNLNSEKKKGLEMFLSLLKNLGS
jgi:chorismate dehydratase